jgi:hypothetical protein
MIETPILKKRAGFCVYIGILGIKNQPTILLMGISSKIKTIQLNELKMKLIIQSILA